MVYLNGRIPLDKLTAIGGGLSLEHKAAVSWISARAAVFAETGIMPIVSTPDGAYRDIVGQVRQKQAAIRDGDPRRAAAPGHSTHGTGISVDINNITRYNLAQLERIMARFGFRRNIPFESWHFTHDGTTLAGSTGTRIEENDMADITEAQMQRIAVILLDTTIQTAVGDRKVKQALSDALLFGSAISEAVKAVPGNVWSHPLPRPDVPNQITPAGDYLRHEPLEHINTRKGTGSVDVAAIVAAIKALPATTAADIANELAKRLSS